MINDFNPNILEAIYNESELTEYANNPLIEALPPFKTADYMMPSFGLFPHYSEGERQLQKHVRIIFVSRLSNYIEPLPPHFSLIDQINSTIRTGYIHRNPNNPLFRINLIRRYRDAMDGRVTPIFDSAPSSSHSFCFFGVSGVGKSTIIDRTLSFLPQVIFHKEHGILQIVYMKLECPFDGSLKQLLKTFIFKIDCLLGTNYMKTIEKKSTIDELTIFASNLASIHYIGLFIIDEIQNLLDSPGVGQKLMLNFFVMFTNVSKIPVLTVGTPRAIGLLEGTFRQARRISDSGIIIWDNMSEGEEYSYFLKCLWKYQWTTTPVTLTKKLSSLFFTKTQGIHALVVKLFQFSQLRAIRDNSEIITEEIVADVAKEKFRLVAPMLEALRTGDAKSLHKYEDLLTRSLIILQKEMESETNLLILKTRNTVANHQNSERMSTISALITMGFAQESAQSLTNIFFEKKEDLTCSSAIKLILESVPPEKLINVSSTIDLKKIISDGKKMGLSEFESLKCAGIVETPKS